MAALSGVLAIRDLDDLFKVAFGPESPRVGEITTISTVWIRSFVNNPGSRSRRSRLRERCGLERTADLEQRGELDLADPFAADPRDACRLPQGSWQLAIEAETQSDYLPFALVGRPDTTAEAIAEIATDEALLRTRALRIPHRVDERTIVSGVRRMVE